MRTRETRKRHLQVELLEGRFALGALSGGIVLPAAATPYGYSLTDMARETALFTTSGNDLQYYPTTPFQVLYVDPSTEDFTPVGGGFEVTGSNNLTVSHNTLFYVPLLNVDNAGAGTLVDNFPTDASGAAGYFFGQDQLGAKDTAIIVDGKSTPVGAAYLAGPVQTPLANDGTQIITLGVFLSPMSKGTHTVEIQGKVAGEAFQADTGLQFLSEDFIYTVHVV